MLVIDGPLETAVWTSEIGPDINSVPALAFVSALLPSGELKVTNAGDKPFAGGLVSAKRPLPWFTGSWPVAPVSVAYAKLLMKVAVPATAAYNLARLETDLIVVFKPWISGANIANRANGSVQLNCDSGHFEIDASSGAAAWSDIGSGPGKVLPDVVHDLVIYRSFDLAAKSSSTLYVSWDGVIYPVPAALLNVGFQPSNWGEVADVQLQTEIYQPGSVETVYSGIRIEWSDVPF